MLVLACKIDTGGPAYSKDAIPISTEAAGSLVNTVQNSLKGGSDNSIVAFTLNESQVTSYLSYKIENTPNPILQSIQVELRDGYVTIYGESSQGVFTSSLMIKLLPSVNEDGSIHLDIQNVDAGPFQAPQSLLDRLSTEFNALMNNQFNPITDHFKVQTIYIADGMITIGGEVQSNQQDN